MKEYKGLFKIAMPAKFKCDKGDIFLAVSTDDMGVTRGTILRYEGRTRISGHSIFSQLNFIGYVNWNSLLPVDLTIPFIIAERTFPISYVFNGDTQIIPIISLTSDVNDENIMNISVMEPYMMYSTDSHAEDISEKEESLESVEH